MLVFVWSPRNYLGFITCHVISYPCGNSQVQKLINVGKWGRTCDQQLELSRTHQHLLNLSNFQVSHPNVTFSIHLLRKPCSQKSNQNTCLFLENIYEYNNGKKVGRYIYFLSKTMNKRWKGVLKTSLNDSNVKQRLSKKSSIKGGGRAGTGSIYTWRFSVLIFVQFGKRRWESY